MKVIRGSGRVVLIAGNYVFKFPRIYHLLKVAKIVPRLMIKFKWRFIFINAKWGWQGFRNGIRQNVAEYHCWRSCAAPFLVPTYFSIGLLNIQKFQQGTPPSRNEMKTLLLQIDQNTNGECKIIDQHCFNRENFIKNNSGYSIVDYGDSRNYPFRFTHFIVRWQSELATILSTKIETPSEC